ncbi:hypothetical protein EJB05_22818, partial [Eragrostis curvula]
MGSVPSSRRNTKAPQQEGDKHSKPSAGACAEPRSLSAIVGDTATGHHLLIVDGYSCTKELLPTGQCTKSQPFTAAGSSWRIHLFPNGQTSKHAKSISIYLHRGGSGAGEPVKARAKFSLLDRQGRPVESHTKTVVLYAYSIGGTGYGFHDFIKRDFLEKSEYLFGDCLRIRCDITVFRIQTEDRAAASPFITPAVPPSDLSRHFGDLLQVEAEGFNDVTFRVAGETFRANRYILAARSPVFKAQLFGAMRESTASAAGDYVIQIGDTLADVFKALLHFVYTDSLPEMEGQEAVAMAQHLLEAADRYDMQRLKLICEDILCRHLDVSTVATTLLLAEQHSCKGLNEACFTFLKSSNVWEQVMASDGFDYLTRSSPATVKEIMSRLAAR